MANFIPDTGPLSFDDVVAYSVAGIPDGLALGTVTATDPISVNDPNYNSTLPDKAWVFSRVGSAGPPPFTTHGNSNFRGAGAYSTVFPLSLPKIDVNPTETMSLGQFRGKGALYQQQGFKYFSSGQDGALYAMDGAYANSSTRKGPSSQLLIGTPPSGFECAMSSFSVTNFVTGWQRLRTNWAVWDGNNPLSNPSTTIKNAFTTSNLRSCPALFAYGGDDGGGFPASQNIFSFKTGGAITSASQFYQVVPSQPVGFYFTGTSNFESQVDAGTGSWATNGMFGSPVNTFVTTSLFTDTSGEVTGTVNGKYNGYLIEFGSSAAPFRGLSTASSTQAGLNQQDWKIIFFNDL